MNGYKLDGLDAIPDIRLTDDIRDMARALVRRYCPNDCALIHDALGIGEAE